MDVLLGVMTAIGLGMLGMILHPMIGLLAMTAMMLWTIEYSTRA